MIRIKRIQIPELPTKQKRRLYVYLPHDYYRSDRRYPVLYMFDGHNVFYDDHATYGKSWGMKEYLTRTKLPLILVAVECNTEGERRLNEYSPWDIDCIPELGHMEGLGRVTMDWMSGPLKQYVDGNYRTLADREHTLIAGSSMGGLMALYAVSAYNDVYSRAAALSPCFWIGGEKLHRLLSDTPFAKTTRVYMDYGTAEEAEGNTEDIADMFLGAQELTKAGADAAARAVPGAAHNEAAWEKRIPVFMDYLLK
ncbi:MAG: alpha/beta hydrolase [Firmicutes bacterium]|nr:alpha/beta hydrolase [Bacillota bacterium]MBQ3931806.1 alpha/beta hydrolase [Bacillota bacterium]